MTWKFILALGVFMTLLGFGIWDTVATFQADSETVAHREALPTMERVGAVEINNNTVYLWTFDFEGKRCLWATVHYARGGVGGLTCWEETP